ncbi:MAG: hypothetical protein IID32_00935 [Planctomycetes bacterium]|nr:hypothetical protein [Planctomycetota bacterium]
MKDNQSPAITLEEYLQRVGQCREQSFGKRFRNQFQDTRGTAEIAMLAAPSQQEYDELQRILAAMTEEEKTHTDTLADEQIQNIAQRAKAEPANVGIFINGYVLTNRNLINKTNIHS